MDMHDPVTGDTGSATTNIEDLSFRSDGAGSQSNDDSDVSHLNKTVRTMSDIRPTESQSDVLHPFALMSAEAKEARCLEIEKQEVKLRQELPTLVTECQPHHSNWHFYNRRYLHLRAQIDSLTESHISDAFGIVLLDQSTRLIAIDTQRAKAQAGLTRVMRRDLEISAELKELAVKRAKLKGVEGTKESDEKIEGIDEYIRNQHETRRTFGQRLFWYASRAGGY